MNLIDNLTAFSDQVTNLILDDRSVAVVRFKFDGNTERWRIDVSYGTREMTGIGLCCHPNILRQWRNVIPFGLACVTSDQTDPVRSVDFATGRVKMYLLNQSDVAYVESNIMGAP